MKGTIFPLFTFFLDYLMICNFIWKIVNLTCTAVNLIGKLLISFGMLINLGENVNVWAEKFVG